MEKEYLLETNNLCKTYGKQKIVEDINMHIEKGKIYGLLGRNGAGKTSIMKMILGLTTISSGEIKIFGESIKENPRGIYSRLGSLIEAPGFYPSLSAYENLKIFSMLKGTTKKNAIKDALDLVNLSYQDKKPFSSYSLGMKQRLGIANALMNEPEFLILDEPTNGLDPIGIAELREFIRNLSEKEGKTILISSHQLSEMEQLVDTIGVLHETKLVEECDMSELAKHNRRYIKVQVSDVNKACMLMEQKFGIHNYKVMQSDIIRIYDFSKEPQAVNRMFLENELEVSQLGIAGENLEEHFKMITGGVGIA
ncbi:MAG: ABC transporter ATP-binding protein [Lachnospiraceae bacterium]|nr:ABC transporter ATP-binding protein [Lachnospiraceae bacterium]